LSTCLIISAIPSRASIKRAWLSKYADYEVLGESRQEPLPGFLIVAGAFYNQGKEDAYAVSIAPGKDVGVIIDLGKEDKITSVVIKNRGNQAKQAGLTVSISKDKKQWQSDAKWITEGEAWGWNVSINKPGRYVKISKDADEPLELKWVKVLMGGFYNGEELERLRYNNWGEGPKFGDLGTAENHFPSARPSGPWEFCWCMRGGWFAGGQYQEGRTGNGTPAVTVLAELAKCRSWDGYSLPDVGPFPNGRMPDYFYGLCDELEKWMGKNKESLIGVKGGPWPERVNVPVTTKSKTWYLFAWPQDDKGEFLNPRRGLMGKYDYTPKDKVVTVKNVRKAPVKTTLLANGEKIDYTLDAATMTFVIPKETASATLDVIKIEW